MSTPADHIERAKHNQRFAEHFDLDTTEFRDWVVTGYFYSALHWVDAYLTQENVRMGDGHAARNTAVNNEPKLVPISRSYRKLYSYSKNVRYDLVDFDARRVKTDVIPKVIEIREHIEGLLSQIGLSLLP